MPWAAVPSKSPTRSLVTVWKPAMFLNVRWSFRVTVVMLASPYVCVFSLERTSLSM